MWVETESLSFTARHEEADEESAQRTLDALEDLRLKLEDRFDEAPGDVTVVVHPSPAWLNAAHPFLPARGWPPLPAGRRYLAGWAMARELHVLERRLPRPARRRRGLAGGAARHRGAALRADRDRREQLQPAAALGAPALLALSALVLAGRGRRSVLRRPGPAIPCRGADSASAGQRPAFPPSGRDAIILGGTVFDLLERQPRTRRVQPPHLPHAPRRPRPRDPDRLRRVSA